MRHLLLLLSILISLAVSPLAAEAQGKIEFRNTSHNFGDIQEMGGHKRAYFVFKNTGNLPAKIAHVQASCGCTTPQWTKEAVNPGDTGFVIAEYNPHGRPGIFSKNLTVTSDAEPSTYQLKITGKVLEKPKTAEDLYTDTLGPELSMVTRYLAMGMTSPSYGSREDYYKLYNPTDHPVTVTVDSKLPKGMTVRFDSATIPPKKEATMAIKLEGPERKAYGYVQDDIYLKIAGKTTYRRKLEVSAMLEERPRTLSAEEAKTAPRIMPVPSREVVVGQIAQNQTRLVTFEIRNDGSQPLEIYEVQPRYDCLKTKSFTKKIKPGKTGTITVEYRTNKQIGEQYFHIPVYCNDRAEPMIQLGLRATVVKG